MTTVTMTNGKMINWPMSRPPTMRPSGLADGAADRAGLALVDLVRSHALGPGPGGSTAPAGVDLEELHRLIVAFGPHLTVEIDDRRNGQRP